MTIEDKEYIEFLLDNKLHKLLPDLRNFWNNYDAYASECKDIGVHLYKDSLWIRNTTCKAQTQVHGYTIYPFIYLSDMNMSNLQTLEEWNKVRCLDELLEQSKYFKIEEFVICKLKCNKRHILAFVPDKELRNNDKMGSWIYLTRPEIYSIQSNIVPPSLILKLRSFR